MRKTRSSRYKHAGGMAPLNYTMTPGANVGVYGRFPTEVGSDPFSVKDLDVYYGSALSRGCGIEDSSRTVPADMGSNGVQQQGGRRRSKTVRRRGGYSSLTDPSAFDLFGTKMLDVSDSLMSRPYVSTTAPNKAQSLANQWSGNPDTVPASAKPEVRTWDFKGMPNSVINPSRVITTMPSYNSYLSQGWNFGKAAGGARKSRRASVKRRRTLRRRRA